MTSQESLMPTSRILRRLSVTAVGAAVFASGAASSAQAASITVCQKKKGGAVRVIKSTKKCKKSEVRLTIPTGELVQGPAGSQGAKGDRGPGAVRIAGDGGAFSLGSPSTAVDTITVGGINLKVVCGNALVLNAVNLEVTSPLAGTVDLTRVLAENTDNAIDGPLLELSNTALVANTKASISLNVAGGDAASNRSTFTAVIDAGSKTVTLTGSAYLPAGSTGCSVRGLAVVND